MCASIYVPHYNAKTNTQAGRRNILSETVERQEKVRHYRKDDREKRKQNRS